ncbi:DUF1680-domain-containing protein [Dacryopinax primogenitus]|uniref:DUF1680-domain-containing protein n=1 Tax=Dacryopinax primogenitus (strain DJM 731) TaxID=1858805 RepID=M5FX99_DACPD|nr:DUF1680-domain-containing protein [Dacryopinax primogenitus]EJT98101.1 DUF1680-domain-containing protein [Dacryopinax primogenitus]
MRAHTLPSIIRSLRSTGRAYALTWTEADAPRVPHPFWDSDVYKTLEACCYALMKEEDAFLREFIDESVGIINRAQHADGYINSHYTVLGLSQRFTNLRDKHELYQLGHLCEASAAHHQLTGSWALLTPALKYVSLVAGLFGIGEGQKRGYPGHEEVEIGLMRLYELTGRAECLKLAGYFILERGRRDVNGETFYDHEARARGADPYDPWGAEYRHFYAFPRDYAYQQAHVPLLEQEEIVGHSVRAMYYLIAACDYALHSGDTAVLHAVERLYTSTTRRTMYLTCGLGSVDRSEGFAPPYWLPDQEEGGCYSETCASFALAMLSQRMLRHRLNGEWGDVLEGAVYNAVLGSVSAEALGGKSSAARAQDAAQSESTDPQDKEERSGIAFYYQNPLTTFSGHTKARSEWFDVACCPPNVAKLFGLLPELAFSYSQEESVLGVHFFVSAEWEFEIPGAGKVRIEQETDLPWSGSVRLTLTSPLPISLAVRIPGWCPHPSLPPGGTLNSGYFYLPARAWTSQAETLSLPWLGRCFPTLGLGSWK